MAHPEDNSAFLTAADEVRGYEFQRGEDSRDDEMAGLAAQLDLALAERDAARAEYAAHMLTHQPPPPPPDTRTIIGMSSPKADWPTRIQQVGPEGITARRIFAWLGTDEQDDIVTDAHRAGLMPVYSFKVSGLSTSNLATFDAKVDALMRKLNSHGKPTEVAFHHEPNPDITGALFVAFNERIAPIVHRYPNLSFGPFLNGWLLDRQVDLFTTYTSRTLLAGGVGGWDWFGIDTYESGTITSPGETKPADRVPKLVAFVNDQGYPGKPLGIGEYNGYSAATIKAAGDAFLAEPTIRFACMWNATTGKGYVLEGDRLAAFKATKADSRVRK